MAEVSSTTPGEAAVNLQATPAVGPGRFAYRSGTQSADLAER